MLDDFEISIDYLIDSGMQLLAFLDNPEIYQQLLMILACYLGAWFLARRLEPYFEELARNIKGKPTTLRVVISLLRRLQWVLFTLFATAMLALQEKLDLRAGNFLLLTAVQLSLAWLLLTTVSQTIRNRVLRQAVAYIGWLYVAILVLGISGNIAMLLDAVGFNVGTLRVSLLLLLKILLVLGFTFWVAISIGNFLDAKIQRNDDLAPGLRVLIGKILRITLLVLALLMALSGIGIDLTVFSVLSGAIGVGIGFGLQKVVSNFISGLIILADESIKPGDTISLGDTFGWIRELRARFVSVVTRDGREYLIPNEDFITREVINWSFSDALVRLDVSFGVSYASNPHEVARLAIAAACEVSRVVESKKPVCWLTGFGESSLDFVLRFWIQDPQNGLTNIRGQVLVALWDTFKANNINIPYPHRELIFSNQPWPSSAIQGGDKPEVP